MMKEMQNFNNFAKAGKWIGWIKAHSKIIGILTNKQSRKLAKKDYREVFI